MRLFYKLLFIISPFFFNILLDIPLILAILLFLPFYFAIYYFKLDTFCTHSLITFFCLTLYAILFLLRFLVVANKSSDSYFGRIVLARTDLSSASKICAIFTICLLSGVVLNHRVTNKGCFFQHFDGYTLDELNWFKRFSFYGSLISIISFSIFVFTSGSPSQLVTSLLLHEKRDDIKFNLIANLGLSAWSIISSISLTFALHFTMQSRTLHLLPFILASSYIMIFILGSRLDVFTVILNLFILQRIVKGEVPRKFLIFSGLLLVPIFILILKMRTKSDSRSTISFDWITYPILDASQVVLSQNRELFVNFLNFHRVYEMAIGYLPRFLYPDKPSMQNFRLDTIVAHALGNDLQKGRTGWPTGAFTELFIYGGIYFMCFFAVCSGFAISSLITRFRHHSTHKGIASLKMLLIFGFVFNWYKDGDLFLSIQGFVRNYIYLIIFGYAIAKTNITRNQSNE